MREATAVGAVVLTAAGCVGDASPPSSLSDGSPARPPPVELEGVDGPTIATRVRVVRARPVESGSPTATCTGSDVDPNGVSVERVDVRGQSVTYLGAGRGTAHGCDAIGPATTPGSWCGRALGRLEDGRLKDPRLSLTCADPEGAPVAFAWIDPLAHAAFVVVSHPTHDEVYPVAGDVPVRIAGEEVDTASSRATFAVTEHASDGRRLRSYELEAAVSG